VTFWGVRGSIPTPGKTTVRYGGNTPCIEVRLSDNMLIILDAGSGIRNLGEELTRTKEKVNAYLMITHAHWDHIQGFPFFRPAWDARTRLTIVGPSRPDKTLQEIIADQMSKIYFPVQLNAMSASVSFKPVVDQDVFKAGKATIRTFYVHHPGYTVGYRIEYKGSSLVYISDNEPYVRANRNKYPNFEDHIMALYEKEKGDPNARLVEMCQEADVLIHDATYLPEEMPQKIGWGHSDYPFALKLAADAKVKRLYLFHHDHTRTDDDVDNIFRLARAEAAREEYLVDCQPAVEGESIDIF